MNYLNFFYYKDVSKKLSTNINNFTYYSRTALITSKPNNKSLLKVRELINFFFKNGNFFKTSIAIYNVFSNLYSLFCSTDNSVLTKHYKYFKEFFYNFSIYRNYKNLNYLNDWLLG